MTKDQSQEHKQLSQERFGRYAQGYVASQTHAAVQELAALIEMADPQPYWLMLDIATGGGHTALAFAPRVQKVIAADLTRKMLLSARAHAKESFAPLTSRLAFHQADAESLPYMKGAFHALTCRIAPHHFPNVPVFFAECQRVLKPGGIMVLQDHLLPDDKEAQRHINAFERLRDPSHRTAFSESGWLDLFTNTGLIVLQSKKVLKKHKFLPFAERQGCTPEVIAELAEMMRNAPPTVVEWRNPQGFEGDLSAAVFQDWHIQIAAQNV